MTYRYTSERMADGALAVVSTAFFVALPLGWIMNVVKFALALGEPLTGLECLRAVGIVAFPIGIILGFI